MVRRLGWSDRVSVAAMDVDEFTVDRLHTFDAAVARGFGPPNETLACAVRLVRPGGRIVISEPPVGDRWDAANCSTRLGVVRIPHPEHDGRRLRPRPDVSRETVKRRGIATGNVSAMFHVKHARKDLYRGVGAAECSDRACTRPES